MAPPLMGSYLSINRRIQHEVAPIKKSRFIGTFIPITHAKEVLSYIKESQQRFPSANHHCWAYQLKKSNEIRFSDDGEPSGCAGKPILSHIQGNQFYDCLIIVTRIFGGAKLGIGGLVRAYGHTAAEVIKQANIITITPTQRVRL